MKTIKHLFSVFLLCAAPVAAFAQTTAFIYQGRLAAGGLPYTGPAEMQFTLFDALAGGAPVATNTPAAVSLNVTDGLFTVPLDFGAGAFSGADRFLEIQIRTNLVAFATLSPRQALAPAPYALRAQLAGTVTNNSITVTQIASGQVVTSLNGMRDDVHLLSGVNVTLTTNGNDLSLSAGPWSPNGSNTFYSNGSVAIGAAGPNPRAALDVRGNMLLGNGLIATRGKEDLRIIRGVINPDGSISSGTGFTSDRLTSGVYKITFSPRFPEAPTVVAAVRDDNASFVLPVVNAHEIDVTGDSAVFLVRLDTGFQDRMFHFTAIGLK